MAHRLARSGRARAILITQCIQRDFVAPIGAHEPPPNLLHVGHREAARLLGADPESGPLAQLMRWARAQDPERLAIVHVRDQHDAADPAQRAHLEAFGAHCVRGTRGAELVLDLERGARADEIFVDAIGLADVEETDLRARIEEVAGGEDDLRVAVVGVWTDAKVTFLLYDLATRLGIRRLATCGALTASASRTAHFHALDQLRRVLGVEICGGVGELADFLVPGSAFVATPGAGRRDLPIEGAALGDEERAIVSHLFRDAARVSLRALSGGFSGARVWTAEATDALGHRQAPSVLKIAPRATIGEERAAFERVEPILGNDAPRLLGVVDGESLGGLRWSFASMGSGKVRTLKSLVEGGAPLETIERVLRVALEEVLGRFSAAAAYEPLPLLAYYRFSSAHAASVARNVAAVAADASERAMGAELVAFYERGLAELGASPGEHHFVSYVHGDLNGANVLVDARENVWLIDFFHTKRGHVIQDVVKLENDLLFLFTKIAEDDLPAGRALIDALAAIQDLRAPLGDPPSEVAGRPELLRAWSIVRVLRAIAAALVREDRDPTQWHVAALRYAAHTLSFDEASPAQKRLALHASATYAREILADARRDRALRVDFVAVGAGRIGMTICPGRADRGRDLERDLDALAALGATALVPLVTPAELQWAGVPELATRAEARGLAVLACPIRDQGAPTDAAMRALLAELAPRLERGETVVAHCMGGLGRSGLLAACALVSEGLDPAAAIERVRAARGPRAVESAEQERFVAAFATGCPKPR